MNDLSRYGGFADLLEPTPRRSSPSPTRRPDGFKTQGLINWEADVEAYARMSEGNRNYTYCILALRGRSLEISGNLPEGESLDRLRQASLENGYLQEEGEDRFYAQGQHMRNVADQNHSVELSRGSSSKAVAMVGRKPVLLSLVPLVTSNSCTPTPVTTPDQIQRYVNDVFRSSLAPSVKRQLYTAALIQRDHLDWTALVMSARATAAAAKVNRKYVGSNWRKAEKQGFIGYNPGVDFETAKLNGVDFKSSEITLNLDIYPTAPPDEVLVNLADYANQASNFQGYIKYARARDRAEKLAHLRENDITTAKVPEPAVEPVESPAAATEPFTHTPGLLADLEFLGITSISRKPVQPVGRTTESHTGFELILRDLETGHLPVSAEPG